MEEKETDNRTLGQIFVDIHRVVKRAESDEKVDLEKNIAQSVDLKSKVDSLKESFLAKIFNEFLNRKWLIIASIRV